MSLSVYELKDIIRDTFEDIEGKVSSVDSVFEKSDNEKYYKLVISIHNLSIEDTLIIHTKFIFKVSEDRQFTIDDSFVYLYDINCIYHKMDFKNKSDLGIKIKSIIESNKFGNDIKILSDFIEAPAMFLNYYMKKSNITDYSIFEVKYDPKFKTTSCDKTTFDFEININNNYNIGLTIHKKEKNDIKDKDVYKFHFKFIDEYKVIESNTLTDIHYIIGSSINDILNEKLKQ